MASGQFFSFAFEVAWRDRDSLRKVTWFCLVYSVSLICELICFCDKSVTFATVIQRNCQRTDSDSPQRKWLERVIWSTCVALNTFVKYDLKNAGAFWMNEESTMRRYFDRFSQPYWTKNTPNKLLARVNLSPFRLNRQGLEQERSLYMPYSYVSLLDCYQCAFRKEASALYLA